MRQPDRSAPRSARASARPAAGRARRGCRPARRPGSGWSSRTPPSKPRSGPPARPSACAGSVRRGAGGQSTTARFGRRARPARCSAVRRSTANLVQARVRTWCDARRRRRSREFQEGCGLQPGPGATVGANDRCDGVRCQVRTRRSPKPRHSAAFRRLRANLNATGATGRFAPLRGSKRQEICGFQAVRCDAWVRRANPESRPVASELSRGARPYQYSSRKDPDHRETSSGYP